MALDFSICQLWLLGGALSSFQDNSNSPICYSYKCIPPLLSNSTSRDIYIYIYICVCVCVCVHPRARAYIHTYIHTHTHTYGMVMCPRFFRVGYQEQVKYIYFVFCCSRWILLCSPTWPQAHDPPALGKSRDYRYRPPHPAT